MADGRDGYTAMCMYFGSLNWMLKVVTMIHFMLRVVYPNLKDNFYMFN